MKSADRTTGNGDKQEGPQWRRIGWTIGGGHVGRCGGNQVGLAGRTGDRQSQEQQAEGDDQLMTVDEIPRLQQNPDRQDGRDVAVDHQQDGPPDDRIGHRQFQRQILHSDVQRDIDQQQGDQRRNQQAAPTAIDPQANRHGDRQRDPHREDGLRIDAEDRSDHQPEDRQNNRQGKEQDQQKQNLGPPRNHPPSDLTNRLPAIAEAHDQRAEIMDGADEDRSEQHPKQRWQPAPEDGDRRTHDRSRSGDAREMMAEDHFLASGHKIHVIPQLAAGDFRHRVQSKDASRQPSAVRVIGQSPARQGRKSR